MDRTQREHLFIWTGGTDSNEMELGGGAWGTLLVPSGSDLIGETVQFMAVSSLGLFQPTALLTEPKLLAAGANPLTCEEQREAGSVGRCFLRCSSSSTDTAVLLWKQ
jgi:hypothetical protein